MAFVAELILVLVALHAGLAEALLEDLVVGRGVILMIAAANDFVTPLVEHGHVFGAHELNALHALLGKLGLLQLRPLVGSVADVVPEG